MIVSETEDFISSADIAVKNIADEQEERRQNLLNNKHIRNAEQLFNTEINKVILNKYKNMS